MSQSQSVCVIIDGDQLFRAVMDLGLWVRYDFKALKEWLVNQRDLKCCKFYCGEVREDRPHRKRFYDVLHRCGIEVVKVFHKGSRSAEAVFDEVLRRKIVAKIAWDVCECTTGNCERLVFVTNGPGMTPIIEGAKRRGVSVELVFFRAACSEDVISRVDQFRELRIDGLSLGSKSVRSSAKGLQKVERRVV